MAIKLLKKKNYLTMIENSVKGPNYLFRNLFAEVDGKVIDIAEDGHNACAILVSHILYHFKLCSDLRATVDSLEKDLISSGWYPVTDFREGAVIVWEPKPGFDNKMHRHIGFYVGNDMAVSNDSKHTGLPWKHHYTYNGINGGPRKIEKMYWHPALNDDN